MSLYGLENRGRLLRHLPLFRPMLFWTWRLAPAHLAVIGCQPPTQWTEVDVREPEWTSMDVPPTVLKTAGPASSTVR